MPRMHQPPTTQACIKLLAIGDGKVGKTDFAAQAAKAGFRVLYLDGDVGAQTISFMVTTGRLTSEEASRIYLLDVGDTIAGGARDTKFVEFMNEFSSSTVIRWDDTNQNIATMRGKNSWGEIWEIRPGLMGPNDLIVMDSWTAYAESVMLWCGRANSVDISTAAQHEMRGVYGGAGLKSTEMLQIIRSSPCHWIILSHPDEFVHTTKPEGIKAKDIKDKDLIVDWTKMVPKSISKPQGLQMPKYFTDVAWMELSPAGNERRLNFKPKNDRVGGGHFTDSKSTEEYSFLNLVRQIAPGFTPQTDAPMPWLTIVPAGEASEAQTAAAESQVLDGTTPKPITGSGMSSLFKKAK